VSWASSPSVRLSMQHNRPRDTKPELALRSAVHAPNAWHLERATAAVLKMTRVDLDPPGSAPSHPGGWLRFTADQGARLRGQRHSQDWPGRFVRGDPPHPRFGLVLVVIGRLSKRLSLH
jgi:hypothetical protein